MPTRQSQFLILLLCATLGWTAACSTDTEDDPTDPGTHSGSTSANGGNGDKTDLTQDQEAFLREYETIREEADQMSATAFSQRYAPVEAIRELSFDPTTASDLEAIATTTQMNEAQFELFKQQGFVVLEDSDRFTFENAYSDLYFADMPVLITTDSLLYALHRSYSRILQQLETTYLAEAVEKMLSNMHQALERLLNEGAIPDSMAEAARDVDIYLAVGRSLIGETAVDSIHDDGPTRERVSKVLTGVRDEGPSTLNLFGVQAPYDFSQMRPRGHYTETPLLERYFKTMMWLGRTEMAIVLFDIDGTPVFNRAAFDSASLMNHLLNQGNATEQWRRIDKTIELMVGERDSMNPTDMEAFQAELNLDTLTAMAAMDDAALQSALLKSPYGLQRIMSQIIYTNPKHPEVVLPRVYLLLGQRFVIDSYMFHHVTYDRLKDPQTGNKMTRMLPNPLDVQFALGSNAAGDLLLPEFERYPYQGTLHELRYLVESHPQEFWDANLYNGWLNAIRSLNDDTHHVAMPEAMKTRAWGHKMLNTQMASWAELRHDTLLYAKQSYSAGVGCEYPKAYIEPYPEFYRRMAHLGTLGSAMANELAQEGIETGAAEWFENMSGIMSTLEAIAIKELQEEPLTEEEWNFLRATIEREMVGCGEVQYDGWYASLFFSRSDLGDFKPTIADVHTAPTDEAGNDVGWVLHGATGATKLMVMALKDCEGVHAYVGPVSSYYSVLGEDYKRYTNEEWTGTIYNGQLERPSWTESFVR
ncbi:MAG: DUF3160 domain-containing protein [Myxococcota bacterium]